MIFRYRFGIRPDGNAPEDPQGEFTGKNLLYVASTIEEVAQRTGKSRDEVEASLQRSRMMLFQARLVASAAASRRQSADGLERADAGGVRASRARAARSGGARTLSGGGRALRRSFSNSRCGMRAGKVVKRRYRDGDAAIDGYAEDYAYLIFGLIELFQAGGDPHWLEWARALAEAAGRAVLGCRERRLVQHDRRRSECHPAHEGGLRRRRAVAELDLGAESADAGAPDQRSRALRAHRSNAEDVRAANRQGGPRGANDDGGAFDLPCEGRASRHRRCARRSRRRRPSMREAVGEVRSVQCHRSGRAGRGAVASSRGMLPFIERDDHARRPGHGVCVSRLHVQRAGDRCGWTRRTAVSYNRYRYANGTTSRRVASGD